MRFNQSFSAITSGSTATSAPWFVGDFRLLTCSFSSSGTLGPSRFTIQGSNADGFQNTTDFGSSTQSAGWSLVTGVNMIGVTPGMVTFDPPGYRWVRVTVEPTAHSSASATTIILNGVSF